MSGALLLLAGALVAPPAPDACSSLSGVVRLAVNRDPAVAGGAARSDAGRARVRAERASAFPELSAYARAAQGNSGLVDGRMNTQVGIVASQRVFDFGQGAARLRAEKLRLRAAQTNEDAAGRDAIRSAGLALLAALEKQALLEMAVERADRLAGAASSVNRRLEAGLLTRTMAASIRADAASARVAALDARLAADRAASEVAELTGTTGNYCTAQAVSRELRGVDTGASVDELVAADPAVRAAQLREEAAAADVRAVARRRLPDISLQGVMAMQYDSRDKNWRPAKRLGIDLGVPLIGGRQAGQVAESRAAMALARSETAQIERERRLAISEAALRVTVMRDAVLARAAELDQMREQVEAARAQFDNGILSFNEYIDTETNFSRVAALATETEFALMRQQFELAVVRGKFDER